MSVGKGKDSREKQPKDPIASREARWAFLRRPPAFLDPIMTRFESPKILRLIGPYVNKGQVVVDLGCGWGYYTFALADLVGSEGKVYTVDLSKKCVRSIQKKANKGSYQNIEAHASTAANLSFIKDRSVDFVFANGLLCSMEQDRESAVNEIKRILKPGGQAYISLGAPPPFGLVDEVEWDKILEGFRVERGGIYKELWALVSHKRGAAERFSLS
ncbi:class I SAM-dependent methyltransferase [Chloroflexota bacterium]